MAVSRSARFFLERIGAYTMRATPVPRFAPETMKVTRIPLGAPFPTQQFLMQADGAPAVDRGSIKPWPSHGIRET